MIFLISLEYTEQYKKKTLFHLYIKSRDREKRKKNQSIAIVAPTSSFEKHNIMMELR